MSERPIPGCLRETSLSTQEWPHEAAFFLQFFVPEAPFVTHPELVHRCVIAGPETIHLTAAVIDVDVAAVGTASAHGLCFLEVPDSRLNAKVLAGQRTDRTHINDNPRVWIIQLPTGEQIDIRSIPASKDA